MCMGSTRLGKNNYKYNKPLLIKVDVIKAQTLIPFFLIILIINKTQSLNEEDP